MKRPVAIALSLLLFWVQAFVVAQSSTGATSPKTCCACHRACCVADNIPAPQPQSPAAAPGAQSISISNPFAFTASLAWTLPRDEAAKLPSDSLSPLFAMRVPLFQRNCALLI